MPNELSNHSSVSHFRSRAASELTLDPQAVAFAILFAAALPLIRPRLPLPPKSSLPIKKAARESEREGETERRRSAANDTEPLTARVVVKNIRLWTFLAANSTLGPEREVLSSEIL